MESRRWTILCLLILIIVGQSFSAPSVTSAQSKSNKSAKKGQSAKGKKGKKSSRSTKKGKKAAKKKKQLLVLDDSLVQGKVQRPEAFYILQSTELKYDELEGRKNFTGEIVSVLQDDSVIVNQK